MSNFLLIAIDAGKSYTKALCSIGNKFERFIIRTKVQEVHQFGVDIHDNNYLVQHDGKEYVLGDMVDESACSYEVSKKSIAHKIAIYTSVALMVEKTGVRNVKIAIGAPLNIYKNNVLKQEYLEYIQEERDKDIVVKLNGSEVSFRITEVLVLPESIGPVYKDIAKYKDKNIIVFDMGGLNVNVGSYKSRIPELDKLVVCNKGINILRSTLAEEISTKYGIIVDDSIANDIIKDKLIYLNGKPQPDSTILINSIIDNHITEIINYSKSRGLSPFNSNAEVIFSGGGSTLLAENIKALYPSVLIEDDAQFANCISFYNVGMVKLG